ncbi:uncharacterized protein LOC126282479 [Schistocerca gregaria]|uniref:uncharacterized protein LOC126282479 n=1 Tax=Schistocerca gregaria TaxID=7010 RepID=UPI00211DDB63|nr:uncharacterized protein LOC126282479 [Schistocerca gregaria]
MILMYSRFSQDVDTFDETRAFLLLVSRYDLTMHLKSKIDIGTPISLTVIQCCTKDLSSISVNTVGLPTLQLCLFFNLFTMVCLGMLYFLAASLWPILPVRKQKWTDWIYNAPPGTRMNSSDSGWMEQGVFDDWFETHFLPFALKKEGRRVIIGDNLSSHISIRTLELCEQNNIKFICLPPNATHLLQPLDVAYFSSLKKNWRDVLSQWRKTPEGKKKQCLPKGTFSGLLAKTLQLGEQTASSNLVKGFEKCGLCPVNCDSLTMSP